jgi:hypothetical protein
VIDLAEMSCNLMGDRTPAISHTEEFIVATARSIAGHTLRYGGLHASNPDRRASLLYVYIVCESRDAAIGSGHIAILARDRVDRQAPQKAE